MTQTHNHIEMKKPKWDKYAFPHIPLSTLHMN